MAVTHSERSKRVIVNHKAPSIEEITVTPKMAFRWLEEYNELDPGKRINRKLSPDTIAAYARDMVNGRWQESNDAICFDTNGHLINGQHRLNAICLADVSVKMIVRRGVSKKAQEAMDQGRPRKIPDVLYMRGYVNTNVLAAAARKLLALKDHNMRQSRITVAEVLDVIERHPGLVDSALFCQTPTRVRGITVPIATALHYAAKHLLKQPKKADEFIQVFLTGVPAYPGDPVHKFREKVLSRRNVNSIMNPTTMFFSALRAWNAFAEGEKFGKFQPPRGPVSMYGLDPDQI